MIAETDPIERAKEELSLLAMEMYAFYENMPEKNAFSFGDKSISNMFVSDYHVEFIEEYYLTIDNDEAKPCIMPEMIIRDLKNKKTWKAIRTCPDSYTIMSYDERCIFYSKEYKGTNCTVSAISYAMFSNKLETDYKSNKKKLYFVTNEGKREKDLTSSIYLQQADEIEKVTDKLLSDFIDVLHSVNSLILKQQKN